MENKKPTELVLTGGPCAGKTSAKSYLKDKLGNLGYKTFFAPEVPTMFLSGGAIDIADLSKNDHATFFEVERHILRMQMDIRKRYVSMANTICNKKSVIIYDRAPMGLAAYMPEHLFSKLLREEGLSLFDVRDSFDAVFHLSTAADGAEECYTLAGNSARTEPPEVARFFDNQSLKVWCEHKNFHLIKSRKNFEDKMESLTEKIIKVLAP